MLSASTPQSWSPLQKRALQLREVRRELARRSFDRFYRYVSGRELAAFQLAGVEFADANQYAVELWPRGHGKTTILSVYKQAFDIGRDPAIRIVAVSRGQPFARRLSRRIKRVMRSAAYIELFGELLPVGADKDTEAEWERRDSTADEPTFVAIGVGGQVPGNRADRIICDDILSRRDVQTAAQRDKLAEWFGTELVPVANEPDSRILVIGTRYHEDDLYGRLIRQRDADAAGEEDSDGEADLGGWALFQRQAITEGAALWPSFWPLWRLERRRRRLGDPIFALQYQNDPTGMGGNIFRLRAWGLIYGEPDPATLTDWHLGLDLATSAKQINDQTALVITARDRSGRLWIMWAASAWLAEGHRQWLLDQLEAFAAANGFMPRFTQANIESVQFQAVFAREILRTTGLPVRPIKPREDKVSRARPLAAMYEAGQVCHHTRLRGSTLETQQAYFPNAEHDDLVDALTLSADVGFPTQVFV